jgi:hypothetical protein
VRVDERAEALEPGAALGDGAPRAEAVAPLEAAP